MLRTSGKWSNTLCSSRQCDLLIIPKNRTFGTDLNFSDYGVNQELTHCESACSKVRHHFLLKRSPAASRSYSQSKKVFPLGVRSLPHHKKATSPTLPTNNAPRCLSQTGRKGIMNGRRKIRTHIRLAAIPQPLAERFSFQTVRVHSGLTISARTGRVRQYRTGRDLSFHSA